MTLPLNIILPEDLKELHRDLTLMYEDIATVVNGYQDTWTPTVEGDTTVGVGTYTTQTGYYYRQGLLCDCWFSVVLSAHTGTGDMKVKLPFKIKDSSDVWIGEVLDSNLTYPSGTKVVLSGINDTFFVGLTVCGDGIASAAVQLDTAVQVVTPWTLTGHIRFIGVADEI